MSRRGYKRSRPKSETDGDSSDFENDDAPRRNGPHKRSRPKSETDGDSSDFENDDAPRRNGPHEVPVVDAPGECLHAYAIIHTDKGFVPLHLEGVRYDRARVAHKRGVFKTFLPESRKAAVSRIWQGIEARSRRALGWREKDED